MSVYPYYYSYPRTTNEGYGAFSIKDPSLVNNDAIKRQLHRIYRGWEARLGVTANAEYGAFSRKFPSNCSRAAHFDVNPLSPGRGSPSSNDPKWSSPVLTSKLTQQPENLSRPNLSLPPISYRPRPVTPPSLTQNTDEDHAQFFCRPRQRTPLTERPKRPMPLPPMSIGKSRPTYNLSTKRWESPTYRYTSSPRSPLPMIQPASPREIPTTFPPLYRPPPLPPKGHEECLSPREEVFHYGTELIPFSDVEAVELHMKNRSKLMLSIDELRKRYIS